MGQAPYSAEQNHLVLAKIEFCVAPLPLNGLIFENVS